MLTRKQHRTAFKRTFDELSEQVWHLRRNKRLSLTELSLQSQIPSHHLEAFENKGYPFNLGTLAYLASFYDKRLKIELVDVEEDIKSLA